MDEEQLDKLECSDERDSTRCVKQALPLLAEDAEEYLFSESSNVVHDENLSGTPKN
jgi:hypothetical protein